MKQLITSISFAISVFIAISVLTISCQDNQSENRQSTDNITIVYQTPFYKYQLTNDSLTIEEFALYDSLTNLDILPKHIFLVNKECDSVVHRTIILSKAELDSINLLNSRIQNVILKGANDVTACEQYSEQLIVDDKIIYFSEPAFLYEYDEFLSTQLIPTRQLIQYIVNIGGRDFDKLIDVTSLLQKSHKVVIDGVPHWW